MWHAEVMVLLPHGHAVRGVLLCFGGGVFVWGREGVCVGERGLRGQFQRGRIYIYIFVVSAIVERRDVSA